MLIKILILKNSYRESESWSPNTRNRAVQAGALTLEMDREPHPSGFDTKDFEDYDKAEPFRNLASEWKMNPSILAHRYALSVKEVSSVILGVKNRRSFRLYRSRITWRTRSGSN